VVEVDVATQVTPLGTMRIVDLSCDIAGAYCGKLLVDGGADVVKVEPPEGDPLRRRRVLDGPAPDHRAGSALFQYLASSKSSVVANPLDEQDRAMVAGLITSADAVIWSPGGGIGGLEEFSPSSIRGWAPHTVVAAITPFGLVNEPAPPANAFTIEAMSGVGGTGSREPLASAGSFGDWVAGVFAAMGLLTAHTRARVSGRGDLVDVSMLEARQLTTNEFLPAKVATAPKSVLARSAAKGLVPMIHPTRDGYIGFQVTTGQQWLDFAAMLGREDWVADSTLTLYENRIARYVEVCETVDEWTSARTNSEIEELASAFRLPVAPITDGKTVQELPQVVERGWYVRGPAGAMWPAVPYTFHGTSVTPRDFGPAPLLGQHTDEIRASTPVSRPEIGGTPPRGEPAAAGRLPFEGLRIADFTAFWAGPIIAHYFALLGADVVHVESPTRPDGYRNQTLKTDMSEGWWESSPCFVAANTNKRGLAVDLATADGREVARRLISQCDVVVDNFSPRVMRNWDFDFETLRALNPRLIVLRAPGFGLTGPWADRVAYATTVEQACGVSAVTGFADGRPTLGAGMDPVAGTHAAFAIQLALAARERTGLGLMIEIPQFTSGLNVCAEQVIEYSTTGRVLGRMGNRSWTVAPQGCYRAADARRSDPDMPVEDWVAISVESDDQWRALGKVLGRPDLAKDPQLSCVDGRRAQHDRIDDAIGRWTRERPAAAVVDALLAAGVPSATWVPPSALTYVAYVRRRGAYETVDHPTMGTLPLLGYPAHFANGPKKFHRRGAPSLGEHNHEILTELGYSAEDIADLEERNVVGQRALTAATAW
jgi:crotonobetainyl-CoA:carnitine CoA-transferase CaiB-like acyl-CoA transferase